MSVQYTGKFKLAQPTQTHARLYDQIAKAIDFVIHSHHAQPELDDIAQHVGMSPHHLQRTFSEWAGVSPKKFLKAITLNDAKARLRHSESILDTAFDVGLSGPGRLHDLFVSIDAVTPGEYKSKGDGLKFRYGVHPSPFGPCLIVVSDRGLTGLSFITKNHDTALDEQKNGWENAMWIEDISATTPYALSAFKAGDTPSGELKLLLRGSEFRVKIWEALLRIPEGAVTSYAGLASYVGRPGAARAVANAVASNLVGYIIPCHRVIKDTGAISGYRWQPVRKSAILGLEAARHPQSALETDTHTT